MSLGLRNVATDKMTKFIKIYNIEITISTDYCMFIIMIMSWIRMQ